MEVLTIPICGKCGTKVINPTDGFIIKGNIYVADVEDRGGLVGNAFPEPDNNGCVFVDDIEEYCYCKSCLSEILDIRPMSPIHDPF